MYTSDFATSSRRFVLLPEGPEGPEGLLQVKLWLHNLLISLPNKRKGELLEAFP